MFNLKNAMMFTLLLSLTSCTQFIQNTDSDFFQEYRGKSANNLNIIFSHNINGETHPCGCRNFPLGGVPQAYGVIKSESAKAPVLYIDSGDTFFPSPVVPSFLHDSVLFTANKIAESLDKAGLKFMTPGDNDFALGESFLIDLTKKYPFKFLITNASSKMKLKHEKEILIEHGKLKILFLGVIEPDLMRAQTKDLLTDPRQAIAKHIAIAKKRYGDDENFKIILLSHSGLETDRRHAKQLKEIDWIIGAHSQSYLRFSEDVERTQLVQVLARNHYLGKISLPLNAKAKEKYEILEVKAESSDLIEKNPMVSWLSDYKSNLNKIQEAEQAKITVTSSDNHLPTQISCKECHTQQTKFWQETSHSIAFKTLHQAKASNDSTCVGCHSVGYKDAKGFLIPKNIVISEKKDFDIKKYWKEFNSKVIPNTESIRSMPKSRIKELSQKWEKFDSEQKVSHNFANVQCLNCHVQDGEHPFSEPIVKALDSYKNACIKCHTPDQSPEWYAKGSKETKALASSLNKQYFSKKLKLVSCPKIERN
jgi:2',3'-cyclic-nucleotide 2'-phosphodiesterase (5'-nucleotidase family)